MTSPIRALAAVAALLTAGLAVTACDSGSPDGGKRTVVAFTADSPLSGEALKQAAEQLRHRAELLGFKDPRVSTDGGTLSLSVAGAVDNRTEALTHQVVLEFRPVLATAPSSDSSTTPSSAVPPPLRPQFQALDCTAPPRPADPGTATVACSTATAQEPALKLALGPVAVKGVDIAKSTAVFDDRSAKWGIDLTFTTAGATDFTTLTTALATQPDPANQLAIVIDGAVASHPVVMQPITGGQALITGSFTHDQAQTLAAQLATPALPAGLHPTTP
ncbi:SecDF P1 head subdomain-containing protein [Kitasatospora griseola]|uniref:SecDF P1 head subdomain-containing protein n=1 Tax=Kitasatospora griseola TaxID=2064 RepID=UPI0037F4694E